MNREAHRSAKAQMVAHMQAGQSWHEAATSAGLQTSRATAYRLLRRVRLEGAAALDDQRHGHPTKVRQPVREWLAAFCRAAPTSTGRAIQAALFEQFSVEVSVSQINRLRAALGVRRLSFTHILPSASITTRLYQRSPSRRARIRLRCD